MNMFSCDFSYSFCLVCNQENYLTNYDVNVCFKTYCYNLYGIPIFYRTHLIHGYFFCSCYYCCKITPVTGNWTKHSLWVCIFLLFIFSLYFLLNYLPSV